MSTILVPAVGPSWWKAQAYSQVRVLRPKVWSAKGPAAGAPVAAF